MRRTGADGVDDRELARAATFARWADRRFVDPVVGLFLPGIGDLIGSVAGLYLVVIAAKRKAPPSLLARMLLNLALDSLVGALPIVGDVADLFLRANERNLRLLRHRWGPPSLDRSKGSLAFVGAAILFGAALAVSILMLFVVGNFLESLRAPPADSASP